MKAYTLEKKIFQKNLKSVMTEIHNGGKNAEFS